MQRFSAEDAGAMLAALEHAYGDRLGPEQFEVSGRVEPGFVELNVVLADRAGTYRYAMDFRVETSVRRLSEQAARDLLADFAGHYLDQYFEGGRDLLLPLDFQPYEFGDHTLFARGDVTNPALDRMADAILDAGVPLADDDPRRGLKRPR
jgi:hypothetical protein